jgi:toxin ParE1/3/4
MIEVIVAPQARADLARIISNLAAVASSATAARWNDRLWQTIDRIAEFPGSGARRSRLGAHVRIKIVTPYIVIYEHERGADKVFVLRVVHGRRRITRKLLKEPG